MSYVSYYTDDDDHEQINGERAKARKLSTLRAFYKYFYRKERIKNNPPSLVDQPSIHDKSIIRLEPDEVARLLDAVQSGEGLTEKEKQYHKRTQARDLAILTLFLGTGIRISELVGINMEGPFINLKKAGAQNPEYIMPADKEMFLRLQERSGGLIKLVDIAPEEKGAMEFIEQCHDQVKISIAHTCSDYDTAREALEKGVGHMTHLYNAMPGINHREPGPIIAALEAGAEVELIADGIHIHPAMVRTTFRIFGADKVILISDSMEATGLLDGDYQLGGQGVTVKGRKAVLTKDPGVIAGSVTNLFDCMKNCVLNMGIPLEDAVLAATENPAESIGVEKDYGKIAVGNYGNLLLLDKDLQIKNIVQK